MEQVSTHHRPWTRWFWFVGLLLVALAIAGGVLLRPRPQSNFRAQVERAIATGVPVGTPLTQALQWVVANPAADDVVQYGPAGLPLVRLGGRSAAECAGIPPDGLREVTCFRVCARGWLGQVTDQAWVYLLAGEDGLIRGHHVTTDNPRPPRPSPTYWLLR